MLVRLARVRRRLRVPVVGDQALQIARQAELGAQDWGMVWDGWSCQRPISDLGWRALITATTTAALPLTGGVPPDFAAHEDVARATVHVAHEVGAWASVWVWIDLQERAC